MFFAVILLMPTISPQELKEKIGNGENIFILDVREPWEFQAGRIENAINIPVSNFTIKSFEPTVAKDARIITVCEHGVRRPDGRNNCHHSN